MQVQILVHVRPADNKGSQHFELLDCTLSTTIGQIKQQVLRSDHLYPMIYRSSFL